MIRKKIAAAAAAWFCAFPSHAIDALALEVGYGEDRTSLLRFAVVERWNRAPHPLGRKWQLTGYWDFSAALWDNAVESTADLGITPVFRFARGALYLEAAIGLNLMQTRISASRVFSTASSSATTSASAGIPDAGTSPLASRNQLRTASGAVRAELSVRQSVLFGTMPSKEASST